MSKLITKNDLKAIFDEVLPIDQVDYVVEEGTSEDWKYCKWNSGKIEAYAQLTTSVAINSGTGQVFTSPSITVSLPDIGINSIEYCAVNYDGGEGTWVSRVSLNPPTNISFSFMSSISRTTSSRYIHALVIGTWK